MEIELKPLDQVRPYEHNPRLNDQAVSAVAASLKEFGFRQPIVVDGEGVIIVGHTRYKAAAKLGLAKVPVLVAADLSEAQVKAYRIADNATNEIAEWNYELLPIELSALKEMEFDIGMLGFDPEELNRILSGGVEEGLANDFVSDADFDQMLDDWFGNMARVLKPGHGFYIWGGYANLGNYPPYLKKHGLYFSQGIVWDKQHPVLTRKDFMGAFELSFYGWLEGAAHRYFGPNNVTDLWHVKKIPPQQMEHLTAKPVELAVLAMQYSSLAGENVLDLFGGSGSTLIAAEQTGRKAFLMEMDPLYCDVICDRYQRFTGKPAILQRTGESPIPMKPREEKMR